MISDADLEMAVPVPKPTRQDPFALGWRWRKNGRPTEDPIPLTEADLLYQEEDDQPVTNDAHVRNIFNLYHILRTRTRDKKGVRVFADHRIDFQVKGLKPFGPDVLLANGEDREWNPKRGTFPVKDMGARPLYAFEVTSPSTRNRDLRGRFDQLFRAGVPVYVIVDTSCGGGSRPLGIVAFQAGPDGYERLPAGDGRVWVEVAEVFLSIEDDRVVAHTAAGDKVHNMEEQAGATAELTELVRKQKRSADRANKKADAEKKKAAEEKARGDAAEQRIQELEAELRRLRGE